MTNNVRRSSFKVPVNLVGLRWISRKIFEKPQISNFTKILLVGAQFFHAGSWTDRQTDMTELIVAFRNFANAPKNSTFFPRNIFLSSFIKLQLFPYTILTDWFLVAFTKFRELRRVCLSVCPSVRMELGSHWRDFQKVWYFIIFRTSVQKNQVSLKSDKNKGYVTWLPMPLSITSRSFLLRMTYASDKSCRGNKNTLLCLTLSVPS
jgi:hypothetical protein